MGERKTIKCFLPFCDKGKWENKEFFISFVSLGVYQDFEFIDSDEISFIRKEFGHDLGSGEYDRITSLLYYILKDNGYNFSAEWIMKNVQLSDVCLCVEKIIKKDIEESKRRGRFFNEEMFKAALNKYWRPFDDYEYYVKMDIPALKAATRILDGNVPKEIIDKIYNDEKSIMRIKQGVRRRTQ